MVGAGANLIQVKIQLALRTARFECEIACIDGELGAIGQAIQEKQSIVIHARKRAEGLDWAAIGFKFGGGNAADPDTWFVYALSSGDSSGEHLYSADKDLL